MPKKALAAGGAMLGFALLAVTGPAWCSDMNTIKHTPTHATNAMSNFIKEQIVMPPATLPELTLDEVLLRVSKQSPKLSAFSQESKAREFEARQAGLRPNPELSIELENVAGNGEFSGTDYAETTVRISQLFELGGKRIRRQEVGRIEQELSEQEYAIAQTEVLSEATTRFLTVLAAQKRLIFAREQIELTQRILQTVEDRIAAGKAAVIDKIRFQRLVAEARLRQTNARQELTAARQTLATTWGSNEVDFEAVQGQLEKVAHVPSWPELASLIDQSPEIALRQSVFRRANRTLALELANSIPDLTFSIGAKNDQSTGDNALLAEVSMPLQIFDRNQHAVAAARARMAKAEAETRTAQLQLRAGLAEAWRELQSAHSEVAALREEILPATQKTFDAVTYGYQAGKFGLLEVLDAEQTLFAAKSRYIDALKAYHQALSELELLLGQKISPTGNPADSDANKRG